MGVVGILAPELPAQALPFLLKALDCEDIRVHFQGLGLCRFIVEV